MFGFSARGATRRLGVTIVGFSMGLIACGGGGGEIAGPATEDDETVARTAVVRGDGQLRLPGTPVAQELMAAAVRADGTRVERAGMPVTVVVDVGGGTAQPRSSVTDTNGLAYVSWTLGPVGDQRLSVSIDGAESATFGAQAVLAGPILFSSERTLHPGGGGMWDLYAMEADGSNPVPLTFGAVRDRDSSWSPDGSRIVFERYESADNVMVLSLMDLVARPLAYQNPDAGSFTWSPDGAHIAFSVKHQGPSGCTRAEHNLWVMDADGTDPVRLTNSPCGTANKFPDWSPDGSRLAFESEEGQTCCSAAAVWTMGSDGTEAARVSTDLGYHAHWLPDGRHVVVGGWSGEPSATLRLLDTTTGEQKDIWTPQGRPQYVMPGGVSPDGRFVVAEVSLEGEDSDVWRIDLETGEAVNLTNRPDGFDGFPSWRKEVR